MNKKEVDETQPNSADETTQPVTTNGETCPSKKAEHHIDADWLKHFYKECGREVTLAYSTLNQMKNWAMIIAGAVLSGLSFGAVSRTYPNERMFIGVVIAYAFTLRFFVRAILCYINLLRWNTLQSKILHVMLRSNIQNKTIDFTTAPHTELLQTIEQLYVNWRSPISRKSQVLANLKLGFSLLFALSLFFLLWGALSLWDRHLVQGLIVFAIGNTFVEINDFLTSRYFDTTEAHERRTSRKKEAYSIFPIPESPATYILTWVIVLLTSLLVSFRDSIWKVISALCP